MAKRNREGGGTVLRKDAEVLKNRVLPTFRCVTVKENIMRQLPKFEEVCISEIGCRTSADTEVVGSWCEDAGKVNKSLAREEGNGGVVARAFSFAAGPCSLARGWLVGQICCQDVHCKSLLPWMRARLLGR